MQSLSDTIGEVLSSLREEGFEPPLFVTCVAVNGAMLYMKMSIDEGADEQEGLDTETLAQYYPDGPDIGFQTPINLMIIDRRGEAAKVELRPETAAKS